MSTGSRDWAFLCICMYRSDGERMTSINSVCLSVLCLLLRQPSFSRVPKTATAAAADFRRQNQTFIANDILNRPTSFNGCLRFSDVIFKVSSLEIFFLTFGFSKTMFRVDPFFTEPKVFVGVVKAVVVDAKQAMATGRSFIVLVVEIWWRWRGGEGVWKSDSFELNGRQERVSFVKNRWQQFLQGIVYFCRIQVMEMWMLLQQDRQFQDIASSEKRQTNDLFVTVNDDDE